VDEDGDNAVTFGYVLQADPATHDLFLLSQYTLGRGIGSGAHWAVALSVSKGCTSPAELLRWSRDASRLYAEVNGIAYVSRDSGRSWSSTAEGGLSCINDLQVDPGHPGTVIVGTSLGVFGSTNGGAAWKRLLVTADSISTLAVPSSGRILAGACGIWLSANGGSTWKKTLGCIDHRADGDYVRIVLRLVTDPSRPDILYAAENEYGGPNERHPLTRADILRSTDGGRTWRHLVDGASSIIVDPQSSQTSQRPQTLYILLLNGDLRRSTDDGSTWQTINDPGPQAPNEDVLIDPADPQTLYASRTQGVFRSRDGGFTWELFGSGLAGRYPDLLFLDPRGRRLFTGTLVEGLFQLRLPAPTRTAMPASD
jgi:photosystem II stability/assembly factor-like uncharacterized protein